MVDYLVLKQLERNRNMRIDDIIPYKRNARNNERAIPAVAASIKEFGLRGTIGLESPDNPVIVFGHTRVQACKQLGWEEIPDSNIEYCNDLTPDQIKAFRIADNKTGDIATYNKAMLREEVRSLGEFDMSRFGIDFKSKLLNYGSERLKTDRAYNLHLINRENCTAQGMPKLSAPGRVSVKGFVSFNYAKSMSANEKRGKACHFFIDDYQFERIWTRPEHYLSVLKGFKCVLTPDFSLYLDMPDAMQRWNRYRSQALGAYWQAQGLCVVPTLSWAQPESYSFCFDGIPKRSIVTVSTVGIKKNKDALAIWADGMKRALKDLQPREVWLYGTAIDFDFGNTSVKRFKNSVTQRMGSRE